MCLCVGHLSACALSFYFLNLQLHEAVEPSRKTEEENVAKTAVRDALVSHLLLTLTSMEWFPYPDYYSELSWADVVQHKVYYYESLL